MTAIARVASLLVASMISAFAGQQPGLFPHAAQASSAATLSSVIRLNNGASTGLPKALAAQKKYLQCETLTGVVNASYNDQEQCYTYDPYGFIQTYEYWYRHVPVYKTDRTCDINGNILASVLWRWVAGTGCWVFSGKEQSTYNSDNKTTAYLSYVWDTVNSSWNVASKEEYAYDASSGNVLSDSRFNWNAGRGDWVDSIKYETTYDANGKTLTFVESHGDTAKNAWVAYREEAYSYDASGNMLVHASMWWDTTIWRPSSKHEYTYDDKGRQIKDVYSNYRGLILGLVLDSKAENSYDSAGNVVSSVGSAWDTASRTWVLQTKYDFSYDTRGNELTQTHSTWNSSSGTWTIALDHKSNSYDTAGRIVSSYIYDASGLLETRNYVYDSDGYILSMDDQENAWEVLTTYDYYDPTRMASSRIPRLRSPAVSARLGRDCLFVRISAATAATVELFTVSGKKLFSQTISAAPGTNRVGLPLLASGTYLCRIAIPGEVTTQKLLK
jgi:hypothetical protein